MPRIGTGQIDQPRIGSRHLDLCLKNGCWEDQVAMIQGDPGEPDRHLIPDEVKAAEERGIEVEWEDLDCAHPPYSDIDYECDLCGERLTDADNWPDEDDWPDQ